jgi:hypothetical protein
MPAIGGGGIPTLSQVREWNTNYLTDAVKYWTDTAVMWEEHFSALVDQIGMPGGTRWRGEAADAAFTRAYSDRLSVIGQADQLHEAARIARTGADDISWARDSVLRLVDAAESAGYVVGEDFSVTKPGTFPPAAAALLQAQAQAIAHELRTSVGTLVATDTALATKLTAATSTLGTTVFPESVVQAVDFKQGPPGPFPESPWEYNNDYTTNVKARGPDGKIVDGGSLVSLDDVWNELHRCFNCNFPIGGAPQKFPKVGDQLPLEMRIAGAKVANLPVEVTKIDRSADAIDIEFATLPGHEDGPGSTIHFRWSEQGGAPNLDIRGYITEGPGSENGPFAAPERVGYTALAQVVWQPYIDNVVTHVVQSKGYEALPLRVIGGR